jgi:hypothetical protein
MSSSNTIYLLRVFAAGGYLSEALSPPMTRYTPPPPPLNTVYLFTQGRGEGGS